MTPAENEALLRRRLDGVVPTLEAVWPIFKECARQPVDVYEDGLLFEANRIASGDGPKRYEVHLCRQFIHSDEAEDEDIEQLSVSLTYPSDVPVSGVKPFWSYDFANSFDAFFAHAEHLDEFASIARTQAIGVEIDRGFV
jgi:hypothetical protein